MPLNALPTYKVNLAPNEVAALRSWFARGTSFKRPGVELWARTTLDRIRPPGADGCFVFNKIETAVLISMEIRGQKLLGRIPGIQQGMADRVSMAFALPAFALPETRGKRPEIVRGPAFVEFDGGRYFIDRDGSIEMDIADS